ncbi:MAG: hypothetical protein Kow0010_06160 [Dehalococcoidia bacterium]
MSTDRTLHALDNERVVVHHQAPQETPASEPATLHPVLALQRQVGNANVTRLIQAQHGIAREGDEEEELQASHDIARQEEEEALQASHDIGRQDEEELQMKAAGTPQIGLEGGPVGPGMQSQIQAKRGRGSTLPESMRGSMEAAFGTDFGDVRVHHDSESDALSRQMTAKAFTTGSDIFLRKDVDPNDSTLLAHELTHVVQQRAMAGSGGGGMSVRPAGDQYEQEADAVAKQVTSLGRAPALDEDSQA